MTPANRIRWLLTFDGPKAYATCTLPLVTKSEANERPGHWRALRGKRRGKKGRSVQQREAARLAVAGLGALKSARSMRPPYVVTLARFAPSTGLDSDNLAGALKAVRDGVADALGTGDGPLSPVEWLPEQQRHPTYAVQITIAWTLEPTGEAP